MKKIIFIISILASISTFAEIYHAVDSSDPQISDDQLALKICNGTIDEAIIGTETIIIKIKSPIAVDGQECMIGFSGKHYYVGATLITSIGKKLTPTNVYLHNIEINISK